MSRGGFAPLDCTGLTVVDVHPLGHAVGVDVQRCVGGFEVFRSVPIVLLVPCCGGNVCVRKHLGFCVAVKQPCGSIADYDELRFFG